MNIVIIILQIFLLIIILRYMYVTTKAVFASIKNEDIEGFTTCALALIFLILLAAGISFIPIILNN